MQTATGRIESVGGSPMILTADGNFDTATSVAETIAKLGIGGGTATFTGTLSAEGAKGELAAEFADIEPLTPLAGRALAGGLSGTASGTFAGQSAHSRSARPERIFISATRRQRGCCAGRRRSRRRSA